jgi:hypothetical protein
MLREDEHIHLEVDANLLKEVAITEYQGGYSGFTVRIVKGLSYHVGATRGQRVEVGREIRTDDSGTLVATSQRAVFLGSKKTIEMSYSKLISVKVFEDAVRFHFQNRRDSPLLGVMSGQVVAAVVGKAAQRLLDTEEPVVRSRTKQIGTAETQRQSQNNDLEFFRAVSEEIRKLIPGMSLPEPKPNFYYQIPGGIPGVHFELSFHGRPRNTFAVELHFEKADKSANVKLLREMRLYRDQVEKETGVEVFFEEDWRETRARIWVQTSEVNATNELRSWAVDKMAAFHRVLSSIPGGLKNPGQPSAD